MANKQILFVSRPNPKPSVDNFRVEETPLPDLSGIQQGDVYVKSVFLSVDPYMRGRMNEGKSYIPGFELNQPITGIQIVEVIQSNNDKFVKGDLLKAHIPWKIFQIISEDQTKTLVKIPSELKEYASHFIGACGHTGLSALLPIEKIGEPKPGEIAFVSGAAGAVGSVAGQILKLKGLKVYGSAGTDEKVKWLKEIGFDGAFNYNTTNLDQELKSLVPEGVDIFFDNVGGETLEILLNHMKTFGRVILCGSISNYNTLGWESAYGVRTLFNAVKKSLKLQGFIVSNWQSEFPEASLKLVGWFKEGKIKAHETIKEGFENAPQGFIGLFSGENQGKMLIKV